MTGILDRVPRRLRLATALLAAVVAAATTGLRVRSMGPYVEVHTLPEVETGIEDYHILYMTTHGGETVDTVRVEALTEGVEVVGKPLFSPVPSGARISTRIRVPLGRDRLERVRVVMDGRVRDVREVEFQGRAE